MSAVTYHGSYVPTADVTAKPVRKGIFARILDAMMEARMREANRLVEMHTGYLSEDSRLRYERMVKEGQPELPFGR